MRVGQRVARREERVGPGHWPSRDGQPATGPRLATARAPASSDVGGEPVPLGFVQRRGAKAVARRLHCRAEMHLGRPPADRRGRFEVVPDRRRARAQAARWSRGRGPPAAPHRLAATRWPPRGSAAVLRAPAASASIWCGMNALRTATVLVAAPGGRCVRQQRRCRFVLEESGETRHARVTACLR